MFLLKLLFLVLFSFEAAFGGFGRPVVFGDCGIALDWGVALVFVLFELVGFRSI